MKEVKKDRIGLSVHRGKHIQRDGNEGKKKALYLFSYQIRLKRKFEAFTDGRLSQWEHHQFSAPLSRIHRIFLSRDEKSHFL